MCKTLSKSRTIFLIAIRFLRILDIFLLHAKGFCHTSTRLLQAGTSLGSEWSISSGGFKGGQVGPNAPSPNDDKSAWVLPFKREVHPSS